MAFPRYSLIEPLTGGEQQIESTSNFLKWKKVKGPDGKFLEDHRESYGGKVWRIVAQSDDEKEMKPTPVGPLIPASLPIPKLPPEAVKDVTPAPIPTLPDLDPAGDPVRPSPVVEPLASPVEVKRAPGRPKKVTA